MVEKVYNEVNNKVTKFIIPGASRAKFFTEMEDELSNFTATEGVLEIDERDNVKVHLHFGDEADVEKKQMDEVEVPRGAFRLEHREPPKPCFKYLNIDEFAQRFVGDLLDESLVKGNSMKMQSSIRIIEGFEVKESTSEVSSFGSVGTYICTIQWPTIEEFNPELGLSKIEEYVSFWVVKEDWKNCVNYLGGLSDETCDFHDYEVIYSIPCKQYPVAQATASIFFTLEVSRVKPKSCLVDVYYNFEGSRLKHIPGKYPFQEVWLFNIVDAKLKLFKTITF